MRKYVHAEVEWARDYDEFRAQTRLFEAARLKTNQQGLRIDSPDAMKEFLCALAANCHDMGVDENCAAMQAGFVFWDYHEEAEMCIHNYYVEHNGTFGKCRSMNKEQRKQLLLDEFLKRNYKLRYNTMTHETEYADLMIQQLDYLPLTDRIRYDMRERANKEGISVWDSDLKQRLASKSVRDFEPMFDFLARLPKWDKKPRIRKLAETIPTDNKDWPERFYRWFISMVSHWYSYDPRFPNSIIPVLVGPQGCGKSQWIRALLPEELQPYYHDGYNMRSGSDAEAMMNRYALINIDEFDAIPPRQEPVLKHLLQLGTVHVDNQSERRYCSFIATSNHYGLHRDTSGSRRYIFVEITGQIRRHNLSLMQIYAEAVWAVNHNERTYLTKAEEMAMQRDNEAFREQDISEQLFLNYYEPLTSRESVEGGEWLTAYQIYESLEKISKKDLGMKRCNKLGGILRKYCAPGGIKRGKTSMLYHVMFKL